MTSNDRPSPSAKIYAFPGRSPLTGSRLRHGGAEVVDLRPVPAPLIMWGNGWHHEVAVQEEAASRTR